MPVSQGICSLEGSKYIPPALKFDIATQISHVWKEIPFTFTIILGTVSILNFRGIKWFALASEDHVLWCKLSAHCSYYDDVNCPTTHFNCWVESVECPFHSHIIHMGVSKNRGTPKWMVYNGKPYWNGWFGGTPIFGNTHILYTFIYNIPTATEDMTMTLRFFFNIRRATKIIWT